MTTIIGISSGSNGCMVYRDDQAVVVKHLENIHRSLPALSQLLDGVPNPKHCVMVCNGEMHNFDLGLMCGLLHGKGIPFSLCDPSNALADVKTISSENLAVGWASAMFPLLDWDFQHGKPTGQCVAKALALAVMDYTERISMLRN